MNHDTPIVVGISGLAGAGKTSTAEGIVPGKIVHMPPEAVWDHMFFAMPLYSLASIRRNTLGENSIDRQLYQTMEKFLDIFVSPIYGGPSFDRLVNIVKETVAMPLPLNKDLKPREFLQDVGYLARQEDPDCFAKFMDRKIKRRRKEFDREKPYIVLVSDLRYPNEAEMIRKYDNSLIIKLDASPENRADRLTKRDGKTMTLEELSHESESFYNEIVEDVIINTNDTTLDEQIEIARDIIVGKFNIRR